MNSLRKEQVARALREARDQTLNLLRQVPDEFLKVRVHGFYSPIGWHFGHIGMTEEYWVCVRACGEAQLDDKLAFLFANIPDNPKDNRVNLPDRAQILDYLAQTRERTLRALETANLESDQFFLKDAYAWEFALQHEYQHQETIAELLQLIHQQQPLPKSLPEPFPWRSEHQTEWVEIPGGVFERGAHDPHAYDNECPAHKVEVKPFRLAKTPVTAFEWSLFMQEGGYARKELWSAAGWAWKEAENARMPEYWFRDSREDSYYFFGSMGLRAIRPEESVQAVSWYEAEAFARWSGARLPEEVEWEYAARAVPGEESSRPYPWGIALPDHTLASFGFHEWQPALVGSKPLGVSAFGILGMAGSVWEWTASPFLPYPGFRAYPYDGYSKDHMDGNHYVCRGGSWATSARILRSSFRNWYVPTYRQGFLGVRLAEAR
ncbi:MAG: SUMF1/EgtB/PvdO family nonheme iron enzyme [Fimbriimonadia bacterium]|nr:SUMF1/EgtB/PvdO family nonheme iron enzyme [Fimbriimonadia bacterium]